MLQNILEAFVLSTFRGEKALYNMVEICLNPDSEIIGTYLSIHHETYHKILFLISLINGPNIFEYDEMFVSLTKVHKVTH